MGKVIIRWTYRRSLKNIYKSPRINDKGLYCITGRRGGRERVLYIGKTARSFHERIRDHEKRWTPNYRYPKFVRFGVVEYPRRGDEETEAIIDAVEKAIIYQMSDSLVHNNKCTVRYSVDEDRIYTIHNTGRRGPVPALINMKEHML